MASALLAAASGLGGPGLKDREQTSNTAKSL